MGTGILNGRRRGELPAALPKAEVAIYAQQATAANSNSAAPKKKRRGVRRLVRIFKSALLERAK